MIANISKLYLDNGLHKLILSIEDKCKGFSFKDKKVGIKQRAILIKTLKKDGFTVHNGTSAAR